MTPALLLIDIQHDFLNGGALEVPNGNEVIPIANAMMNRFDTVIATQDWHPAGHGSFASTHNKEQYEVIDLHGLPRSVQFDHRIQGTHGAEFHPDLESDHFTQIIQKGSDPAVDSYSALQTMGDESKQNWMNLYGAKGSIPLHLWTSNRLLCQIHRFGRDYLEDTPCI